MKIITSSKQGFTLVEIMIVVAIIALLAAIAIPNFNKARKQSQNTAFINNLRVIEHALLMYGADYKSYPPDVNGGIMPPELAKYLPPNSDWSIPTPIGGNWDYCGKVWGIKCGIAVYDPSRTASEMTEIDAKIDDGNLDTGHFRLVSGQYMEIVEQ